ncbi:hypothetical protein SAMN02745824_2567 [Parasphingorhabdus marina DSM 22363]|uniref:DOMON-like domain-containing protein n=1 Tax=Parasphingorhabdus marina DSM 22363 TaxID=1123272 RepID=A0A1N6FVZ6_9SPHN|nr:DOMON-like domain-containing protein [Parasphingorhabdus marina]SIN99370.1 hypothetical protein SAMN02745824_2567 [Parasphingorhabdus marina DSM 22363]
MRLSLQCHPDTPGEAVTAVSVHLNWSPGKALVLDYWVEGDCSSIIWPTGEAATRADGLWQTTCLELFVRQGQGPGYAEYNFSPDTRWAAYAFGDYREDMQPLHLADPPRVTQVETSDPKATQVRVMLNEASLTATDLIGLSAIIEEKDGRKSCWSLAHPTGKPDFHHRDCFVHQLRAT